MLKRKKLLSILAVAIVCTVNNAIVPSPALATEVTDGGNKTEIQAKTDATTIDLTPTKLRTLRAEVEVKKQENLAKARLAKEKADAEEKAKQEELQRQQEAQAILDAQKAKEEADRLAKIKAELDSKNTDEKKKAEILSGEEQLDKLKGTASYKEFILTFYTSLPDENGNSLGINCHGKPLADGMVANNVLPQGTKLYLEGMGNFEVADTGAQEYFGTEDRLDVFVPRIEGETDEEYKNRVMGYGVKHVYGFTIDDPNLKVISDTLPPSAPVTTADKGNLTTTQESTPVTANNSPAPATQSGSNTSNSSANVSISGTNKPSSDSQDVKTTDTSKPSNTENKATNTTTTVAKSATTADTVAKSEMGVRK